jgi:hypothetical protein
MMPTNLPVIVKIECDQTFENETNDAKFIGHTDC